jgi:hypothetical protein
MTHTTYGESADCQRHLAMKTMTMIVLFMFKERTAIAEDCSWFHFETLSLHSGRLSSTRLATSFRRTQKTHHGTADLAWLSLITVCATANLIRDSITLLPPDSIQEPNHSAVHRDRVADSNSMIVRMRCSAQHTFVLSLKTGSVFRV